MYSLGRLLLIDRWASLQNQVSISDYRIFLLIFFGNSLTLSGQVTAVEICLRSDILSFKKFFQFEKLRVIGNNLF